MPYPTPNDPAVDAPDRPGRGWYLLSLALLLVGVAAFVASISTARQQLDAAEEQLQRFVVPGQVTLRFDEPGEHHLYYEKFGELDGERFDTYRKYDGRMPRVLVTMTGPRGEPVEVEPVITEEPHRHRAHIYGGGRGNSEFVFDVERPGDHTLVIEPDSPFDDRLLMAAGPPIGDGLMSDWLGPFGGAAVLAFAFFVAAVTTLVTYMRRHGHQTLRDEKRQAESR